MRCWHAARRAISATLAVRGPLGALPRPESFTLGGISVQPRTCYAHRRGLQSAPAIYPRGASGTLPLLGSDLRRRTRP